MNIFLIIIFVLAGAFSLLSSVKNFDWFFNNSKAKPFVKIFGRNGARIFYSILGIFIIILGLVLGFKL